MTLKRILAGALLLSITLAGCGGSVEYNASEGGSKGEDLASKKPAKAIKPGRDSKAKVKKADADS